MSFSVGCSGVGRRVRCVGSDRGVDELVDAVGSGDEFKIVDAGVWRRESIYVLYKQRHT